MTKPLNIFCFLFLAGLLSPNAAAQNELAEIPFYIGTYTRGTSQGIYRSSLNLKDGSLAEPKLVAEVTSPSFLTIHPSLNVLYAVSEVSAGDRQVLAYRIGADGSLTEISSQGSGGDGPCYVSTDHAGQYVFVANYGSGSICAIRIQPDGRLGEMTSHQQHVGKSVDPRRQQGPHAHCIMADPSDQFVCAADLGLDQVIIYRLERASGELKPTGNPLKVSPGNGPRHLAFHPDGRHAFVIHEMTCRLSSCAWDATHGTLTELGQVSTLPGAFEPGYSTAEVLVHPSGNFVYGSNRGHHSIARFQFRDGQLTSLGHTPTGGETPRNFRIDPTGQFLLAENQQSDSIVAFRIDAQTGSLSPVAGKIAVGSPCCIKFLDRR